MKSVQPFTPSMLLKNVFRNRKVSRRRNRRSSGHVNRMPAAENLESRQMLTAGLMWDGDVLRVSGSDGNDFITVQQDELGLKVFTEDSVFTQYEGREFATAAAVHVSGQDGHDVLLSYSSDIPVTLNGDNGNDVLYTNSSDDVVDGGAGSNWIYTNEVQEIGDNAFGISGFSLTPEVQTVTPAFDADGRVSLQVDVEGETSLADVGLDVSGAANVSAAGVSVVLTGAVSEWNDAFGISGVDLTDTSVTVSAGTDVNAGDGYRVELDANLEVSGTEISVAGFVDVQSEVTSASFAGTVSHWKDAFGISGVDLTDTSVTVSAGTDVNAGDGYRVQLDANLEVSGTEISVAGIVDVQPEVTSASFAGTVSHWEDAFGIPELELTDALLSGSGFIDSTGHQELNFSVDGNLLIEETSIEISGAVDVTPDSIDAVFLGAVENWDDAFGIDGFDLDTVALTIAGATNRADENELRIGLDAAMDISGTAANVTGFLEVTDGRTVGALTGHVDSDWIDAFGIDGLLLQETEFAIEAIRDQAAGNSLAIDVIADLDLFGTDIDVTGNIDIVGNDVYGSLTGVVEGTWSAAFGIGALHLNDTIIGVSASKTSQGAELQVGVTAGINVFGADLNVTGSVDIRPDGVVSNLTSFVSGEWSDAFQVPGLNLKDTGVSVGSSSQSPGLDIKLDTDLELFGTYIDVIGELDLSPSGVDLRFSPPASLGFTNLLGIQGFDLDAADLEISASATGLAVAVASTVPFGELDVELEGQFSINRSEVQASLTGKVAEWDNAFDVAGLNLNDVVLTLGAESGTGGASLYVGVAAGIEIGDAEVSVAGLVGIGSTGWEVAFRGSVDALTGDDVIDFANTLNAANNPSANQIPEGALGDIELRDAYINFAPNGGNEQLGIEDGFGLGAAFYDDGKLLGSGEFVVDMAQGVFEVGIEIPELELGPVDLDDVLVDLRLSPTDSHYRVAGTATLLGAQVSLEGFVGRDHFSLQGEASVNVQGLSASAEFLVDQSGVRFSASVGGDFINDAKSLATRDLRTAANAAQMLIDEAQDGVDFAQRAVDQLEDELQEAREEAQEVVDDVKADIAKAKSLVDNTRATMNSWSRTRSSRYSAWRKAVAKTNSVKWYQKAKYKAIEVGKYSSYAYSVGRHNAAKGVYYAANATYTAVRNAAGWVLDNAGVEANPKVVGLKAVLFTANAGLDAAELVLNGAENANQGLLNALDTFDSIKVNRITFGGSVSSFSDSALKLEIDCTIGGRNHLISLNAAPDDLAKELAKKLMSIVL
ncbi:MAG: hypothetical protein ABJZ55_14815 [Fuerstiella sp.]